MLSEEARTAKEVRKILKKYFLKTKFSVTSKSYAGGDSVSVRWVDGPRTSKVNKLIKKFEMGSFNGMNDLYEYDNVNKSIPQVKYVLTSRSMSNKVRDKIISEYNKKWDEKITDMNGYNNTHQMWNSQVIYRIFKMNDYM